MQVQVYSPESRRLHPIREHLHNSEVKLVFNREIENEIEESHLRRQRLPPIRDSSNTSLMHTIETTQRGGQTETYFYTGVRQPINNKTANFLEHIKLRLFVRKLDEIVIDFLIRQFVELQAETLNTEIDAEDPHFRKQFIKNNRKLISHLRGRLCQNKEFVRSTYTQMFVNMLQNSPRDDLDDTIVNQPQKTSPPRGSSVPPLGSRYSRTQTASSNNFAHTSEQFHTIGGSEMKTSMSPEREDFQTEQPNDQVESSAKREGSVKLPQIGNTKKEQARLNSAMISATFANNSIQNRQPQIFLAVNLQRLIRFSSFISISKGATWQRRASCERRRVHRQSENEEPS